MKNTFLILALFLVSQLNGQQQDLINNSWYLQKMEINNIAYFQPSNTESTNTVTANFNNNKFQTELICNYLESETLSNLTDSSFSTNGFTNSLAECQFNENITFEQNYVLIFQNNTSFTYSITNSSNYKTLIITNPQNNKVFYTSNLLSTQDIESENNMIQIYPQLVRNHLFITTKKGQKLRLKIINANGQKVAEYLCSPPKTKIDISTLEKGVYFCILTYQDHQVLVTKKIIKE